MNEFRAAIGARLLRLREQRNLSQKEFAQRIGRTTSTVRRWERGSQVPHAEDLATISDALSTSADWIIWGDHYRLDPDRVTELLAATQLDDRWNEIHALLGVLVHDSTRRVPPAELVDAILAVATHRERLKESDDDLEERDTAGA